VGHGAMDFLLKNNMNKKIAFDIGCNMGNNVNYLLTLYDKIVCFEPNPNLANHVKKTFENYDVEVVQKGLSSKKETKPFHISDLHVISTFSNDWITKSRFTGNNWNTIINVETTTLDDVIDTYGTPDFVKIDVEGYEFEVLSGLTKLLNNTLFGFEWAEELFDNTKNAVNHIQNIGYNNFAYTYEDNLHNMNNLNFKNWDELDIHKNIDINRKQAWGMIYFKV
jgi:FkbM family methyltransferase